MSPYLETVAVLVVICLAAVSGHFLAALKRPYWLIGYFAALFIIICLAMARFQPQISFAAPLAWLMLGRTKFVALGCAVTLGVAAPFHKLKRKSSRIILCSAMTLVLFWFTVMPFYAPAFMENDLANLSTRISTTGNCFQTTDFTCGPAAAVTAITHLGFSADEGQLAIKARSSPVSGTLPACLAAAINELYYDAGLTASFEHFDSLEQLRSADTSLAVVKNTLLSDHCVAILDITDHSVRVADPVYGIQTMTREGFQKVWRNSAITVSRKHHGS